MISQIDRKNIVLLGAPVEEGAGRLGCAMGPAALRLAGIGPALEKLGHTVEDRGNLAPENLSGFTLPGLARNAALIGGWTRTLDCAAYETLKNGKMPIFLGGDHSLSMGTVAGAVRHAEEQGRKLFVLWMDAHADFNTPATSPSGNMHGMSVAFFCGVDGFSGILPDDRPAVAPENVFMCGLRSIDPDERAELTRAGVNVFDMRFIDENGIVAAMKRVIETVRQADGLLHLSFDTDFLDPEIAPGTGTTVRGGGTYREAHVVMEMLYDSGLVTSLDIVELNPFLDDRGKSAYLLVELMSSLFGQKIF
ncbi:arginase [Phyllobacterium salinisoli]|uniref:Arginase n=1 Tax=Phyllobacterium salinisoli TaxID=1899321 RepID=A0A368K1L7_9HYPH|nr:arginase [Phyllobacterium salinisoli]RCS22292.1 arginase [Phyllobacterium salinisoli]